MPRRTTDDAIQSFANAEEEFKTAVNNIPSGWVSSSSFDDGHLVDVFTSWEIVGTHAVESLTNAITAPINAFFGTAKVKSDYLQTGSSSSEGKGVQLEPSWLYDDRLITYTGKSTQPSGAALSDPGISLAQQALNLVSDLDLLITGGPGGKPDWNNIRGSVRVLYGSFRPPQVPLLAYLFRTRRVVGCTLRRAWKEWWIASTKGSPSHQSSYLSWNKPLALRRGSTGWRGPSRATTMERSKNTREW